MHTIESKSGCVMVTVTVTITSCDQTVCATFQRYGYDSDGVQGCFFHTCTTPSLILLNSPSTTHPNVYIWTDNPELPAIYFDTLINPIRYHGIRWLLMA